MQTSSFSFYYSKTNINDRQCRRKPSVTENLYTHRSFVSFFMDRLMLPPWWVIGLINANYISNYLMDVTAMFGISTLIVCRLATRIDE